MKPSRIFIVRHGKSVGNVNRSAYLHTPDYAIQLTDEGVNQATEAGKNIAAIIGDEQAPQFYISPYWRTRQTFFYINKAFKRYVPPIEDVRLREQEWQGKLPTKGFDSAAEAERDNFSTFYYRFKGGESVADVTDRVGGFLNTLHRDFEKEQFSSNCIIVTHGMTMRAFIMRWFHMTVEEFELLKNPGNCQYYLMELQENNKYKLVSNLERYPSVKHKFQFSCPTA
jgi:broad specificity phosphatase PhoE